MPGHENWEANPDGFFRLQNIIYGTLLSVSVVLMVSGTYLTWNRHVDRMDEVAGSLLTYLVLLVGIAAPLFGHLIARGKVRGETSGRFGRKLEAYKSANIIRWATLAGPMMVAALAYMLTAHLLNLIIFLILLAAYLSVMPGRQKFAKSFRLTLGETDRVLGR